MVTCEVVVAEMVMGEAVMPVVAVPAMMAVVAAVMSTAMMAPATREYEVNGIRRSGKQAERAVCGLLRIGPGG
jgi:preprotein translocase subunit SecF